MHTCLYSISQQPLAMGRWPLPILSPMTPGHVWVHIFYLDKLESMPALLYMCMSTHHLYTLVASAPLCSGVTSVSKNGIQPPGQLFSTMNWMALFMLLICCRKFSLHSMHCIINLLSTNLFQILEGSVLF